MPESNPDAERLIALLAGRAVAAETLAEADWQRIVALARRQGVAPLLYARLKERGIAPSPAAAQQLRETYLASAVRNTLLLHEVGKILRALQAAGIPAIPLKGACLAESVYGNIALRPMGDVDLLVKSADLARALAVLRTHGYVAAHPFEIESVRQEALHMPQLFKRGEITLELHWTIVDPRSTVQFDDSELDQLWSRATPLRISGVHVLTLSPADLLLHLCLHASVQHRFADIGLRSFWDVALVIRRYGDEIDWEQFAWCVNQWGIVNGVSLVLQLTDEWFGLVVPTPVMHSLMSATPDEAVIGWVKHKIWNGVSPAVDSDLPRLVNGRVADKLAALRDRLFLSRTSMANMYHVPVNSWRIFYYYPVRFAALWMRYSQTLWRLLRRDKTLTTEARQEVHLREYLGRN